MKHNDASFATCHHLWLRSCVVKSFKVPSQRLDGQPGFSQGLTKKFAVQPCHHTDLACQVSGEQVMGFASRNCDRKSLSSPSAVGKNSLPSPTYSGSYAPWCLASCNHHGFALIQQRNEAYLFERHQVFVYELVSLAKQQGRKTEQGTPQHQTTSTAKPRRCVCSEVYVLAILVKLGPSNLQSIGELGHRRALDMSTNTEVSIGEVVKLFFFVDSWKSQTASFGTKVSNIHLKSCKEVANNII